MLSLIKKTSKAMCSWVSPYAYALMLFAASNLLVGCAGMKKSNIDDILKPDDKETLISEIHKSTNGMPYGFISNKNYENAITRAKDGYKQLIEDINEKDADKETLNKANEKLERRFQNEIIKNSYDINGNHITDASFIKGVKEIDLLKIITLIRKFDGNLDPYVIPIDNNSNKNIICLVCINNPDKPFTQSNFNLEIIDDLLAMPGLGKTLGEDIAIIDRAFIVGHELAHIGDPNLQNIRHNGQKGVAGSCVSP